MTDIVEPSAPPRTFERAAWTGDALQARARAAGLHLLASLAIASMVATVVVLAWYPAPWMHAVGGAKLLAMLVAIDVVLGPLMTLLVFDRRKASLRFDLAAIGVLQLAALAYGLHAAAAGRPVFAVFAVDRFEVVTAAAMEREELQKAPAAFRTLSWTGPVFVGARIPEDKEAREQVLFASVTAGVDLAQFARHYRPWAELRPDALARARDLDALRAMNGATRVAAAVRATGRDPATLRWVPVQGRTDELVAFLDAASGDVVGVARLQAWER